MDFKLNYDTALELAEELYEKGRIQIARKPTEELIAIADLCGLKFEFESGEEALQKKSYLKYRLTKKYRGQKNETRKWSRPKV